MYFVSFLLSSIWCPLVFSKVAWNITREKVVSPMDLLQNATPFLCFSNEASRDRYDGLSVCWSVCFNTTFKKVWRHWLGNCTDCEKWSATRLLTRQLYSSVYSTCVHTAEILARASTLHSWQ